jgi:two-component system phosphate regulon sensor histidine kinase PhoR
MKSGFRLSPVVLFYLMIVYIFSSYIWWTLLLLQKNQESFDERMTALSQRFIHQNLSLDQIPSTVEYAAIKKKYDSQKAMVLGESCVFLCLILVISWRVLRSIDKEIELNRSQKNFLLSITHELRSPIASAKLVLQTLERKADLPQETRSRMVHNGLEDIGRLQSLVENLLLSAKLESENIKIEQAIVNLSALINEVTHKATDTIMKDRIFHTHIAENVQVVGDHNALFSVVNNLVENAVKYSPAGKSISVSLTEHGDKVILSVADEGQGIPEDERRKIFKKFYRIGNEETRRSKGTGLGLYIVDKIISMHKGKIHVKDNAPNGVVFEIVLPRIHLT